MIPTLVESFRNPQLISFKRDKNIGNFLIRSAFNSELLNVHAHDAKHVYFIYFGLQFMVHYNRSQRM